MIENKTVFREIIPAPTQTERQARYVEEHTRCAMCETELEMAHERDDKLGALKEEAHCPTCGIRVRAVRHRVH